MSEFKLSVYQENILNYVRYDTGNLLVNAKAGSGKTSTLLLISDELDRQNKQSLFLAFNKSIVQELGMKIHSERCEVKTIHSTGLTFLRSHLYRKHKNDYEIEIDDSKTKNIIKEFFAEYCHDDVIAANQEDMGPDELIDYEKELIREMVQLMNFCRVYVLNYHVPEVVEGLIFKKCNKLRDFKTNGMKNFHTVIEKSIDRVKDMFENPEKDELTGKTKYIIDYTDMIYLPLYYNMYVPFSLKSKLDYVMVDEAQDLSMLQQLFIQKITNGRTRYIFVGDEKQAIYGFAGADTRSIENIKRNFTLKELPLDICYRCPRKVIKVAKSIVPAIDWNRQREDDGIVEFITRKDLYKMIKPDDMLIGRLNKDLLVMYKTLTLDKKISVNFKNKALVDSIVNNVSNTLMDYIRRYNRHENIEAELYTYLDENKIPRDKSKRSDEQQKQVKEKVEEIVTKRKKQNKQISKQNYSIDYLKLCMAEYKEKGDYKYADEENDDRKGLYEILEFFIKDFEEKSNAYTVKTFIKHLETFLKGDGSKNTPILSTIHMMKGAEADRIFILDYPRFPYKFSSADGDAQIQEENLQYVAITRAKKALYLVDAVPRGETESIETVIQMNNEAHITVADLLNLKDTPPAKLDLIEQARTPEEIFNKVVQQNLIDRENSSFNII